MIFNNSWVEVSQSALVHNLKIFKKIVGSHVQLMPVVKSNAYGHGLLEAAKICDRQKEVERLCTVSLEEAIFLKEQKIKKPILVLSFFDLTDKKLAWAVANKISLPLYSLAQLNALNKLGSRLGRKIKVHLKVDTGTARLGLIDDKTRRTLVKKVLSAKYIQLEGLFTHYAEAEAKDQAYTKLQTRKFFEIIKEFEQQGMLIPIKHAACSAAVLNNKSSHFDAVRLGVSLYGLWSLENGSSLRKKYQLKPALSWKTKVVQVKDLSAGQAVGYGRTYKMKKKGQLAVLPVGYWDGFDRKLSNRAFVLIKGKKFPVVGRVCMNLIMVKTDGSVKVGDEAVLIGSQGKKTITAEEMAMWAETINYEIVTRINPLIKRKIVS